MMIVIVIEFKSLKYNFKSKSITFFKIYFIYLFLSLLLTIFYIFIAMNVKY